jgi:hypothetical protein
MAYVTSNPPRIIGKGIGFGIKAWAYSSTDDAATVAGSNYFTDGYDLGMRAGDIVMVHDSTTPLASIHTVTVSNTTIDLTAAAANTGTTASATELNVLDGIGVTVTVGLAASLTTDGMDITITVKDAAGSTVAAVHQLEFWISEATTGIGLTADSYSGDLTATVGSILSAHTAKKHWSVATAATGIFKATLVASANPADQYVAVKNPVGAGLVVSAASGTNWEGV